MSTIVERPQDFLVIAAGGNAGVQSCFIPGWGSKAGSQSVTKEITRTVERERSLNGSRRVHERRSAWHYRSSIPPPK